MSDTARLPKGAPAGLRGFVACTVDRVDLDLTDMGWIPKPPGMDGLPEPGVEVNEGWTPTTATIKIGWGFISMELPASIVDGQLRLDTSNLMLEGVGDEINKWVDAFNKTLRDNGKQLDSFDVRNGKVTMTKRAIPAGSDTGAAEVAPVTTAIPGTPTDGGGDDGAKKSPPGGCLAYILAGITAVVVAIGLWAATNGGDDDKVSTGADPVPASSSADPTTTTTSTTTTTIAEVGQAPPAETPDEPQVACGDFPAGSAAGVGGYLMVGAPSTCTPGAGAYDSSNCASAYVPCSWGQAPGIIAYGQSGTTHQATATDAITGEDGASAERFALLIRMFTPGPHAVRVQSNCGGSTLTGQAPVDNGGVTVVGQPLESYGECRIVRLEAAAQDFIESNEIDFSDPAAIGRAAAAVRERAFTVDASEAEPVAPDVVDRYTVTSDRFTIDSDWADAVNTTNNVLGSGSVTNDCLWFWQPDEIELLVDVLDGCSTNDHFWVFAAATTNVEVELTVTDTLLATTSTYTNPVAMVAPPITDTSAFATGDPLFNNTIFPCGYGHIAYTACPADEPRVEAGGFVTVSGVMLDAVPIEGDGADRSHTIDFSPSGGPTYTLTQVADGWLVGSSSSATQARALFRDNAITLIAPQNELPEGPLAAAWSTTVDGETLAQPAVPVVGLITTPEVLPTSNDSAADDAPAPSDSAAVPPTDPPPPPAPPAAPIETLESFYEQLSASVASGDGGFSLDRLHPVVLEAYPTECPAAIASFADPDLVIAFVADNGPEPWTWELSDGRSFEIPDAISVTLNLSGRGQPGTDSNAHVAIVDGEYRWFTLCGGT